MQLFDTHSHFDFPVFDADRVPLAQAALQACVSDVLIAGCVASDFQQLAQAKKQIANAKDVPRIHLAAGLHPAFFSQHTDDDLTQLNNFLHTQPCVAIGEIGLDTFTPALKTSQSKQTQQHFFTAQLQIAKQHQLPVLLHIRKSHADTLHTLKQQQFHIGGIAHSFSGGVQEAKAFVNMGFKLGITGQVCNPNAKKLRTVVQAVGAKHLVIETDCPDMLPHFLHTQNTPQRNVPANLPHVLAALADILAEEKMALAHTLWQNSLDALALTLP